MLLRKALEALIDSLEATVRVKRWTAVEAIPEPLTQSAALLLARLGAADRLLVHKFTGATSDESRMGAMSAAVRRLDEAYVDYHKRITDHPIEADTAANALDAEVCEVKATAPSW